MEIVMLLFKNTLKKLDKTIKTLIIIVVAVILSTIIYIYSFMVKNYYHDGPIYIKKCINEGNSEETCKSQFF